MTQTRRSGQSDSKTTKKSNINEEELVEESSEESYSDESVYDDESESEIDEASQIEDIELQESFEAWNPSVGLQEGEELEVDSSAYHLLHNLSTPWPCYSLTFLDDSIGLRKRYPLSVNLIAGTQAPSDKENSLFLLHCSNLRSTLYDGDSENEREFDSDDEFDGVAQLKSVEIPHHGSTNKLSVLPGNSSVIATSSSDKKVRLFNISNHVQYLSKGGVVPTSHPVYVSSAMKDEGYGLDWSISNSTGVSLLASSCTGHVFQHVVTPDGVVAGSKVKAHQESVEGISVNPEHSETFITCSTDGKVSMWDLNSLRKAVNTVSVSTVDVNVCTFLSDGIHFVTGDDVGMVSLYDCRNTQTPILQSDWHKKPITSVTRAPSSIGYEDWSMGVNVASDDGSVSTWDFSIVQDESSQVPSQLMFVHVENGSIKDATWHSQIPGLMAGTSSVGVSLYHPRYLFDDEE
ncbi:hypothetical protein GEMRC1_010503 [Eukaryota sp. GEM-RC1]